jgi:dGTPase
VPLFDRLYRPFERKHPTALEKLKFNEALKRVMDTLVTDLIVSTRARLQRVKVRTVEQVRRHKARLVGLSPRFAHENKRLKEFLHRNLYSHQEVSAERKKIIKCLEGLFNHFLQHPRSLPAAYAAKTQQEPAHRVVCDYIAGMTDNYLIRQYQRYLLNK